nr:coiled-coil domain-containing protein 78 isoform X6 [Oryctolagus cuniculus]
MESSSTTAPPPGVPPRATDTVATGAEGWPPGVPGGAPTWASPLQLGEEQWLQISKDLVGLEVRILGLQEQHEAEVFQLRSEVGSPRSHACQPEGAPGAACGSVWQRGGVPTGPAAGEPRAAAGAAPEARTFWPPRTPAPGRPGAAAGSSGAGAGASQGPAAGTGEPCVSGAWGQFSEQPCPRPARAQPRTRVHRAALGQQLQEAREEARAAGQQLATQAAVSPAPRATTGWRGSEGGVRGPPPPQALQQAQAETARLQLQLKQRTEEHAAQLQRCARQAVAGPEPAAVALRPFLEATLQDIRAAHRSREQQLARAARTFQRRLADLSRRHEELLATHSSGVCPYGHWPGGVAPMARRRHVAAHVEAGRSPVSSWPARQAFQTTTPSRRGTDAASWAQTCQKLWDFSRGTQAELEQERAQLLGRAAVAEQQLSRLQEYVAQHLGRYKQEILRLRKLVGVGAPREVGAALAAELQGPGARSRWPAWPAQSLPLGLPGQEPPR